MTTGTLRLLTVFHEGERLGAGVAALRLVEPLRELGWTPYAWFAGTGPLQEDAMAFREARSGDRPIAFSRRGWAHAPGTRRRLQRTRPYIRAFRAMLVSTRPHVVHANTLLSLPEAHISHRLGIPVVLHVHELPEPGRKRDLTLRWAGWVSDVIVVVSTAVEEMVREALPTARVVVARNGVPIPASASRVGDPGRVIVGSLGSLSHRKGTDVYIEAARVVRGMDPTIEFEHGGPMGLSSDASFEHRLLDRVAELDDHGIRLLGQTDAPRALTRWKVFALPSRQDPYPLASMEAMAAGLPVIASDVGGLREQIEDGSTGILVPPDDPEQLAVEILRVSGDPELRARLGASARARAGAVFSLQQQAVTVHEAYLRALATRFAPPFARDAQAA